MGYCVLYSLCVSCMTVS